MSPLPAVVAAMGHIQGGWSYVWTAYGITWCALSLYALSLWLRWPRKEP